MTESYEARAEQLVRNEVNVCLSSLVSTLANGYGVVRAAKGDDTLADLIEQAFELCTPVQDWEEAAGQENAAPNAVGMWWSKTWHDQYGGTDAQNWCEQNNVDPYEWEIFEHWSVSQWLADQLIEQGERVDTDFAGLCVWGRTTTGQAISMDSVIRRIIEASDKRLAVA